MSASISGKTLGERREQLGATLPIRSVVEAGEVAALAVHIMINTALTGATYDIDGGQAARRRLGKSDNKRSEATTEEGP